MRCGSVEDLPQLSALGERMRLESAIWYPEIDQEHLRKCAEIVFNHPDKFCCFVAEEGSNIVGWLNGFVSGYVFSPMRIAAHDIFYIAPEARDYRTARALVLAFVGWAESLGLKRQLIRLDTGLKPDKVDLFYRRLGFQPIGGQYVRDGGNNLNHCWNNSGG